MKKMIAVLLCACMLLALTGCGTTPAETPHTATQAPTTAAPTEPASPYAIEEIVIGTTSAIETAVRDEYNFDMLASGTSEMPLVYQDTMGQYHPLMATYATEDAQTWAYTIVEGLKWSDGEPVTAEDILFTLQYGDENGSANFVEQTDNEGKTTAAKYTGCTLSEDKMSIFLTLASANVRELSNMTSFRVMPKHIYEGNANPTEADKRVGCGPYMFESFNKEAGTITFTADPSFPQTPNAAKVTYRLFANEDTMFMALEQGDIDMVWAYSAGVPATYQDVLADSSSVTLANVPAANAPTVLAFNNANGPFTNENLRKAVVCALNYEDFKTYLGSKYAEIPNAGFVPTTTVGYHETAKLATDLAAAERYMTDAGYAKNADGFYADAQGNIFGFTLTHRADKTNQVSAAELIKTQLEAFGIQVELEAMDGDSYNAKTSNKFSDNNVTMEAAIYGYTAAGMGMMNGLATIYVDGTHPVQGGCQVFDETFQAIRDEMKDAKTMEQYNAAAGKMQDFYAQNLPLAALYWDNMMYAYGAQYENVTVDFVFGLNNVPNWFTITEK